MTTYMVIETFRDPGCKELAYERLRTRGRGLPEGLEFVNSWLERDGLRVFQLMKARDRAAFDAWMPYWDDLVSFEIVEIGKKPGE